MKHTYYTQTIANFCTYNISSTSSTNRGKDILGNGKDPYYSEKFYRCCQMFMIECKDLYGKDKKGKLTDFSKQYEAKQKDGVDYNYVIGDPKLNKLTDPEMEFAMLGQQQHQTPQHDDYGQGNAFGGGGGGSNQLKQKIESYVEEVSMQKMIAKSQLDGQTKYDNQTKADLDEISNTLNALNQRIDDNTFGELYDQEDLQPEVVEKQTNDILEQREFIDTYQTEYKKLKADKSYFHYFKEAIMDVKDSNLTPTPGPMIDNHNNSHGFGGMPVKNNSSEFEQLANESYNRKYNQNSQRGSGHGYVPEEDLNQMNMNKMGSHRSFDRGQLNKMKSEVIYEENGNDDIAHLKGELIVWPKQASLQKNLDLVGKMDPYCIITCGGEKNKTSVHNKGGKQPIWGKPTDKFSFVVDPLKGDHFHLEIWDEDKGSADDFSSELDMPLKFIIGKANGKEHTEWFEVFDKKKKTAGKIEIMFQFKPDHYQHKHESGLGHSIPPQSSNRNVVQQSGRNIIGQSGREVVTSGYLEEPKNRDFWQEQNNQDSRLEEKKRSIIGESGANIISYSEYAKGELFISPKNAELLKSHEIFGKMDPRPRISGAGE